MINTVINDVGMRPSDYTVCCRGLYAPTALRLGCSERTSQRAIRQLFMDLYNITVIYRQ